VRLLVVDLVDWLEQDLHTRALNELKKLPPASCTPEKLVEVVSILKRTKETRFRDSLDAVQSVLVEAGVSEDESSRIRRRLESSPDVRAKLSR
jgi:hypothetical protein